jgi:hypothetical protein
MDNERLRLLLLNHQYPDQKQRIARKLMDIASWQIMFEDGRIY